MATLMEFGNDWRYGYVELCKQVKYRGARRPSRAGNVAEMRDVMFTLDPRAIDLPLGVNRKPSIPLAAAEAIQLCAGTGRPELTEAVSRQVAQYVRDPDGTVHGNYGSRVSTQIRDIVEKLSNDPNSRQAVIQIWDATKDSRFRLPMPKDIPCTLSMTFGVSYFGRLEMSVMMRSSDVWLGIPYDVFQFRQLQRTVANFLRRPLGEYTHHSVSMHAYEKDWANINDLEYDDDWRPPLSWRIQPPDGLHAAATQDLPRVMYDILNGHDLHCESHKWYHKQLGKAYATTLG